MSGKLWNVDTSALLIMDYQRSIVENFAKDPQLLGRTKRALEAARKAKLKIIYVVIGFRPGYAEVSPRNKSFSALKGSGRFSSGSPGIEIHPELAPLDTEFIVSKHRVSAFSGSDLEMLLRAQEIDTLILTGIATSGVVLSTLRQAADLDYRLAVLADACADMDAEVHACLTQKIFPRQADVMDVEAFVKEMES